MGVMAHYPSRNLSRLGHAKYVRPYLLRNKEITRNNQVWAIDITYIAMAHGFMYLTAIIDLHSRFVVGWDLHNTLEASHCVNVLENAIKRHGKPEIINSDQGSQFTCEDWISYVNREEIKVSMDGKGRATDNYTTSHSSDHLFVFRS
jgi:putative transposase